jgi:cytochrome c peroxidase
MRHGTLWLAPALLAALALGGVDAAGPPTKQGVAPGSVAKASAKSSAPRRLRLPDTPYRYADVELPAHFKTAAARRFDNTPRNNPVTDTGAALGRVLFYDTRLSANNTVACASCHQQKHAFTDRQRFSAGFEGKLGDRHAMSLGNLRYYPRGRFFWDERARTLEEQVLMPIQNKVEMGQDLTTLVEVLSQDDVYPELFRKAFGDRSVTRERIARALAQFLRSLVSYQSKYDEGLAKARSVRDDFANFTAQENRGKTLFLRNCASCHMPRGQAAHFFMNRPLNNGLDASPEGDGGVGDITLNGFQVGLFKSPSLRNVELTAPYMHDGRFTTLEEVIDHYSTGVKRHPNLAPRLRRPMNFSDAQKAALVAFLKTLTDRKFITDPKFSDPFVPVPDRTARGFAGRGPGGRRPGLRGLSAEEMAGRIMAYDKNKDGKVTKDELPERMQHLIALGDTNKDGALDQDEVKKLAAKLAQQRPARGFGGPGGRGFRGGRGPGPGGGGR